MSVRHSTLARRQAREAIADAFGRLRDFELEIDAETRTLLIRINGHAIEPVDVKRTPKLAAMLLDLLPTAFQALTLAKVELGIHDKRKRGPDAAKKKKTARGSDTRDVMLRDEADKILKKRPAMTNSALAGVLASRGLGGREAIRKSLGRTRRK